MSHMENKKTSPVVERLFHFHDPNGKRVVTVYYNYNRDTKTLNLGSCFFRKEKDSEMFTRRVRRNNTHTAQERFRKHPITFTNVVDDADNLEEFHKKIRDMIFEHGKEVSRERMMRRTRTAGSQ